MKLYLKVDDSSADSLISALIVAAREYCENFQNRVYVTQTWELTLDDFPTSNYIPSYAYGGYYGYTNYAGAVYPRRSSSREPIPTMPLKLPKPPLQSVLSIKFTDSTNAQTTFDPANYIVDTASEPGRIALAYGQSFPNITLQPINGIAIQFVAGYGAATAVPENVKTAIKLYVAHRYENPDFQKVPEAVEYLLWSDRMVPV